MGEKNESWNFQERFAQECFSAHGELEYDVSSDSFFGPASVRIAHGPPPIGPLGQILELIFLLFCCCFVVLLLFCCWSNYYYYSCNYGQIYNYYLLLLYNYLTKKRTTTEQQNNNRTTKKLNLKSGPGAL